MTHFHNLRDFIAMGGYASYVWSAYTLVFIVLLSQLGLTWREAIKVRQRLVKNKLQQSASTGLESSPASSWNMTAESEGQ